ncbi:hypothetical protein V3C99_018217 [Haemonchus contortus]|uniref:CUE domain-containing protein n=1 Tax=Haemonchus contortus TaxID=6289 RepID=A0A7I4Z5I3_HAECO
MKRRHTERLQTDYDAILTALSPLPEPDDFYARIITQAGDDRQDDAEANNAAGRNGPAGEHGIRHEEQGNDDADDVKVRIELEKFNPEKEREIRPREHGNVHEEEPEVRNDAQAAGNN